MRRQVGELIIGRMEDSEAGEPLDPCEIEHDPCEDRIEGVVKRAVAFERDREHSSQGLLVIGGGRIIVGEQLANRSGIGDTPSQQQAMVASRSGPAATGLRRTRVGLIGFSLLNARLDVVAPPSFLLRRP